MKARQHNGAGLGANPRWTAAFRAVGSFAAEIFAAARLRRSALNLRSVRPENCRRSASRKGLGEKKRSPKGTIKSIFERPAL